MIRVRPDHRKVDSRFIFSFFQSSFSRSQVLSITKQVTISGIDGSQLKGLTVLLPPLSEQTKIVKAIEEESRPVDDAIRNAEHEIELLIEYRARLIADVVTGKLDVREAAAALPEVDPLAADDEPDDALETDIDGDLDELDAIPEEAEA